MNKRPTPLPRRDSITSAAPRRRTRRKVTYILAARFSSIPFVAGTAILGCEAGPGPAAESSPDAPEVAPETYELPAAAAPGDALPIAAAATAVRQPAPTPDVNGSATPSASVSASSSASSAASFGASADVDPFSRTMVRRVGVDFREAPLLFTASFDGSQRFGMWVDTMRFARELGRDHQQPVRLTYFINTCYFDPTVEHSRIGRARSRDEALVRRALAQVAINAGHDIGNHGVRHDNGLRWSPAQWRAEFDEFHTWTDKNLFRPVRDGAGRPVFPRFTSTSDVAGATGARCREDADCPDGSCLAITEEARFCTQPCNRKRPCPAPTVCGAPTFRDDTDVCVPPPAFPVEHRGVTLFDRAGRPNLERLRPYRIIGYRAPYLAGNDGLTEALLAREYIYDASQLSPPGAPLRLSLAEGGPTPGVLLGFPLMQHPPARTIPMDYNYLQVGADEDTMSRDYRASFVASFARDARTPWNVGHHFSLWRDGAYWRALQKSMRFAAAGCPDEEHGGKRCPDVAFVSFRELSRIIVRAVRRGRRTSTPPVARVSDRHPRAKTSPP